MATFTGGRKRVVEFGEDVEERISKRVWKGGLGKSCGGQFWKKIWKRDLGGDVEKGKEEVIAGTLLSSCSSIGLRF